MSKVIAVANQKGGVAKTTTACSLGVGLSKKDRRVLLIDNDPQASLTEAMGFQNPDELEITLASVMEKVVNEESFDLSEGIIHHKEGVDMLPCNIELSGVETSLVNIMSGETILREYVDMIKDKYDYIIIDCSPNLGMLTLNALTCADSVIIPVQAAYLPVKGLELLLRTISKVRRKMNPSLNIEGILMTMVDKRTNYAKDISEVVENIYGEDIYIFKNYIPASVRAAETPAMGVTIFEHDKNGRVAKAYDEMAKEVICHE